MEKEKKKKEFENSKDPSIMFMKEQMKSAQSNPKLNPYFLAKQRDSMMQSILSVDTQNLGGEEDSSPKFDQMDRPTIAIDIDNVDLVPERHNASNISEPVSPGSPCSPGGTRKRRNLPKAIVLPQEDLLKDHA